MRPTPADVKARLEAIGARIDRVDRAGGLRDARMHMAAILRDSEAWCRRHLPTYMGSPSPACHAALLTDLAGTTLTRGGRDVVVGSRGTAKSFAASLVLVLAGAVTGAEPYIMLVSETDDQAELLLTAVKSELDGNASLAAAYPEACGEGPVWQQLKVVLNNGVMIEAVGARKKIRGRRYRESRPSLVVVDDPEGDDHATSPTLRERTAKWFNGALMKIGTDETNVVVVANAIHRDCLAMGLLLKPSWRSRVWRSLVKMPRRMDLWAKWEGLYCGTEEGSRERAAEFLAANLDKMSEGAELLWPGREALVKLMKERAEDRTSFECEKQCNPVNPAACEFPGEWFDRPGIWFAKWPAALTVRTIAVDPSKGKDARRGDYSAIVKLGRDANGTLWVEADLKRRTSPVIVEVAVQAWVDFRPDDGVIESNTWQELLMEDVEQEAARLGEVVGFRPMENHASKAVRIRRLGPYLSQGKFRFRDDAGTRLLVEQLRDFPVGSHDDGPDALEMALRSAIEAFNTGRPDPSGGGESLQFDAEAG